MNLNARTMDGPGRLAFLATLRQMVAAGELTTGQTLRILRARWLAVDRPTFARLVGVSSSTVAQLEADQANPTVQTLNRVFSPFGMQVGLVATPDPGRQSFVLAPATYEALRRAVLDDAGAAIRAPKRSP